MELNFKNWLEAVDLDDIEALADDVKDDLDNPEKIKRLIIASMPLIKNYLSMINSRSRRQPPLDKSMLDDITQMTITKAWEALMGQRATEPWSGAYKSWLFRIARNTLYDIQRKRTTRGGEPTFSDYDIDLKILPPKRHPEDIGAKLDIYDAIKEMPPLYEAIIKLLIQQYGYREIAEKLNIPIGTVKSRIWKARQLLRDKLQSYW